MGEGCVFTRSIANSSFDFKGDGHPFKVLYIHVIDILKEVCWFMQEVK